MVVARAVTSDAAPRRFKLTAPHRDETVNAWLDTQDNISASVRHLIREYVRSNGVTDPLMEAVETQAQAGRPSKAEMDRREAAVNGVLAHMHAALIEAGLTPEQAAAKIAETGASEASVFSEQAATKVAPAVDTAGATPVASVAPVEEPVSETQVEQASEPVRVPQPAQTPQPAEPVAPPAKSAEESQADFLAGI